METKPMKCYRVPFKPPMIVALRDGRKTETRRLPNAVNANWKPGDVLLATEAATLRAVGGNDWFDITYTATGEIREFKRRDVPTEKPYTHGRVTGAMFMPAWAARFRLTIAAVHDEPLQAITDKGAHAEGIMYVGLRKLTITLPAYHWMDVPTDPVHGKKEGYDSPRLAFADLWDSFNAKRGFSFDSNPTVRVVRFEVERLA